MGWDAKHSAMFDIGQLHTRWNIIWCIRLKQFSMVILLSNNNCNIWRWPLTHILVSLHHQNSVKKSISRKSRVSRAKYISVKYNLYFSINLEILYLVKLRLAHTIPANFDHIRKWRKNSDYW